MDAIVDQWDELARDLGWHEDEPQPLGRPADPAVERLLTPVSLDPEVDAEYRRVTQTGLRMRMGDRLERFWVHLKPENSPLLRLSAQEAHDFMATITDIRLAEALSLGI